MTMMMRRSRKKWRCRCCCFCRVVPEAESVRGTVTGSKSDFISTELQTIASHTGTRQILLLIRDSLNRNDWASGVRGLKAGQINIWIQSTFGISELRESRWENPVQKHRGRSSGLSVFSVGRFQNLTLGWMSVCREFGYKFEQWSNFWRKKKSR